VGKTVSDGYVNESKFVASSQRRKSFAELATEKAVEKCFEILCATSTSSEFK